MLGTRPHNVPGSGVTSAGATAPSSTRVGLEKEAKSKLKRHCGCRGVAKGDLLGLKTPKRSQQPGARSPPPQGVLSPSASCRLQGQAQWGQTCPNPSPKPAPDLLPAPNLLPAPAFPAVRWAQRPSPPSSSGWRCCPLQRDAHKTSFFKNFINSREKKEHWLLLVLCRGGAGGGLVPLSRPLFHASTLARGQHRAVLVEEPAEGKGAV